MIHPITLLLLALFQQAPSPSPTLNHAANPFIQFAETTLPSDSSWMHAMMRDFKNYQTSVADEKVYLQLDKTLVAPGETVWFNAWLVNAGDLLPATKSQVVYVELYDVRGSMIQQKKFQTINGAARGEFTFNTQMPGGRYTIKAYSKWMLNTQSKFEREIQVQQVVLPNVNLKLEFEKKAYGPGDVAIARFDGQSLDNQPLENTTLHFTCSLGGENVQEGECKTDVTGRAYVQFQLPETLNQSDGLLNIRLEHKGQAESISRPVPIVLNKISLQFFPEGGDAIHQLPCRMAFKALNEFGKPADVAGIIVDDQGEQVADFTSYHDGMGAFDFTPDKNRSYSAHLTQPASGIYTLPEIAAYGATMSVVEQFSKKLVVQIASNQHRKMYLCTMVRDEFMDFKEVDLELNESKKIEIPISNPNIGVARLTLFDQNLFEQAERLVFINRNEDIKFEIKPEKEKYLPREEVKLRIKATDQQGNPVQGRFSMAVTDEKLLTFADDKQGHLLASLLLEQEVKGKIEEPNFYFDKNSFKSARALDYLLMTQGWRRFTWNQARNRQMNYFPHLAESTTITGQYVTESGRPVPKAKIRLYPNGPRTTTDANGNFEFKDVNWDQIYYLHLPKDKLIAINPATNHYMVCKTGKLYTAQKKTAWPPGPPSTLTGVVTDDQDVLIGATVKIMQNGQFVRGTITDYDGYYRLQVPPGRYDIQYFYTGYATKTLQGVVAHPGKTISCPAVLMANNVMSEVTIANYKVPLVESDRTQGGQTLTSEQIKNLPTRSTNGIVATTAGVEAIDGSPVQTKGSRTSGTDYYVDGIRVSESQPSASLSESVVIVSYKVPLVRADETTSGLKLTSNQLVPRSKASYRKSASSGPYYYYRPRQFAYSREFYQPQYYPNQANEPRNDFRPTVFWNTRIETDNKGEAEVKFFTSDAITNFRITIEGISSTGIPGHSQGTYFVQKPLSIAVKTPASVIHGDTLALQVVVSNNSSNPINGVLNFEAPLNFTLLSDSKNPSVPLQPNSTERYTVRYKIGGAIPGHQGQFKATYLYAESVLDQIESTILTENRGFPVNHVVSGNNSGHCFDIQLNNPIAGSAKLAVHAYPNAVFNVVNGLERMLRQPTGCFEQVSSSNYPNVMVLSMLQQTQRVMPEVERNARAYLEEGYKKLTGYECKNGGFDWYGHDPGHEGLTAYGILQFTDMAKVYPVDKKMIDRTVQWLKSRTDGKGGWKLNPQSLHGWKNNNTLACYIVWALAEAGYASEFLPEIKLACANALDSKDPYELALATNTALLTDTKLGLTLLNELVKYQNDNGSWDGKNCSVFYGNGKCLTLETTALVALAFLKTDPGDARLDRAMDFLVKGKNEYGFGSTQSTILVLKAMLQYYQKKPATQSSGSVTLWMDGRQIETLPYSTDQTSPLIFKGLEQYLQNKSTTMEVRFDQYDTALPFDISLSYNCAYPPNTANCPISLNTSMTTSQARVGETVRLSAKLKNETNVLQHAPMMVIGIPAGLTLQPWQLKKILDEKKCDFYELWNGYVVFHFLKIEPGEVKEINLDLRADISGSFEAPASQAFLYYSNDQRVWSKPEQLTIYH